MMFQFAGPFLCQPARSAAAALLVASLALLLACAPTPARANNAAPPATTGSPIDYGWLADALTADDADTRTTAVIRIAALSGEDQSRLQRFMRERGAAPLRPMVADSLADNAEGQSHHLVAAGWLGWPLTGPLADAARHQRLLRLIRHLIAGGDKAAARTLCDTRLAADFPPAYEADLARLRRQAND